MAQNLPALRGKFGSTEFFLVTMKASEFVRTVIVPKDMEGWEQLSVEEKFQREINYKRVKESMAPYLARDPDRFFGAFIITVRNHESMTFTSLSEMKILKESPLLGSNFGSDLGILILDGQQLIPLDGQHRLAALKMAITGKDERDQEIADVPPTNSVGEDYVTAILVRDETAKSRAIFSKVNKYAKPTSAADKLITDDDDGIAIICRSDIVGQLIDSRIIRISGGNTLSNSAKEFAPLNTIYKISKRVVEYETQDRVVTDRKPDPVDFNVWKRTIIEFWESFLDIQPYQQSIVDPSDSKDVRRAEIRGDFLICKPIVMEALAEAVCILRYETDGERPKLAELVKRIDTINWGPEEDMWQGIILQGEKVISGPTAMKLAARFIAYLIGWKPEPQVLENLRQQYALLTGGKNINGKLEGGNSLPEPVV